MVNKKLELEHNLDKKVNFKKLKIILESKKVSYSVSINLTIAISLILSEHYKYMDIPSVHVLKVNFFYWQY